ncbi:hypothetical protein ACJX0J_001968 (mitochondrion) [Zea mays]
MSMLLTLGLMHRTCLYRLFLATRKMEPGGQRIGKQGQELFVLLRLARQAWHERHTGLKLHNTSHFQEEDTNFTAGTGMLSIWDQVASGALPLILDFGLIAAMQDKQLLWPFLPFFVFPYLFSILLEGLIRR